MASRVLREFLEENDLTFENLRILKVDKNGDETELDSEELLYGLLNRIRHSNTDRSNRHKEIEKPIDLDEKDYDIPIPKKKFELGMMNKLNLGIELSSLSFAISIFSSLNKSAAPCIATPNPIKVPKIPIVTKAFGMSINFSSFDRTLFSKI